MDPYRSVLFVPGSKPERIDAAESSAADAVVVDLEDGVAPEHKDVARENAIDAVEAWRSDTPLGVRVNGVDTAWGVADVDALVTADAYPGFVAVPDVRGPSEVQVVAEAVGGTAIELLPLIERPSAVFRVAEIARSPRVFGLLFAAIDLQIRMGMSVLGESELSVPRSLVSMAASAADAVAIDTAEGLTVTREFYGGKTEGDVEVAGDDAAISIRPGEWEAATGDAGASIEAFDADIDEAAIGTTISGYEAVGAGDVDITEADVLVSIGRGIEEEDNLPIIEDLADAMGATVSASRPIVDNGWLPQDRQVGQSGKQVTPDVYIAIGISGAVQHVAGMKGAETIIAINNDPSAPIYDIADYGIVDDLFDVVPALTEQFS